MAKLIDISNEKFWDILFDEACVEGQQAKRIEEELMKIAITEAEIRNKAIDDFTAKLIKHISNVPSKRIGGGNVFIVAEELKGGAI